MKFHRIYKIIVFYHQYLLLYLLSCTLTGSVVNVFVLLQLLHEFVSPHDTQLLLCQLRILPPE